MTRCICASCTERTLGGILALLDRGKLGMARMAIGSLAEDLKRHAAAERSRRATVAAVITAPKRPSAKRKPGRAKIAAPVPSVPYHNMRLDEFLAAEPKHIDAVLQALGINPADLTDIRAGRLHLAPRRWKLLWRALGRELP